MARKKSVNIGDMNAYLDQKTGYIRLTSKSKGILRREGMVLNVKPRTHEHSLLLQAIEEKHGDMDLEGLIYTPPRLATKYPLDSSAQLSRVPVGENAANGDTYYWVPGADLGDEFAPHLLITGNEGVGKTSAILNILGHLTSFPDDCQVLYTARDANMETAKEVLPTVENVSFYAHDDGNKSVFHDALYEMRERYLIIEEKPWDEYKETQETFKPIYVVIDDFMRVISDKAEDAHVRILEEIVMLGRATKIHVVLAATPVEVSGLLTEKAIFEFGQKLHYNANESRGLKKYRIQAELFASEKVIVPYHVQEPPLDMSNSVYRWNHLLSEAQPNALPDKIQLTDEHWKLTDVNVAEIIPLGVMQNGKPRFWAPLREYFHAYVHGGAGTGKTNIISVILKSVARRPHKRTAFYFSAKEDALRDTDANNVYKYGLGEENLFWQAIAEREVFVDNTYIVIDEAERLFNSSEIPPEERKRNVQALSDLLTVNSSNVRETVSVVLVSQQPISHVLPQHLHEHFYLDIKTSMENGAYQAEIISSDSASNSKERIITPFHL